MRARTPLRLVAVMLLAGHASGQATSLLPGRMLTTGVKGTRSVAVADLDHDGHDDIVATASGLADPPGVVVLRGSGGGAFGPPEFHAGCHGEQVTVCDCNGDGRPDIV